MSEHTYSVVRKRANRDREYREVILSGLPKEEAEREAQALRDHQQFAWTYSYVVAQDRA
jgi:hypothetical protein